MTQHDHVVAIVGHLDVLSATTQYPHAIDTITKIIIMLMDLQEDFATEQKERRNEMYPTETPPSL